jgi:O-methyltransferase
MADQARTNTKQDRKRTYPPGYGVVEPVANYRPWDTDAGFREVYDLVQDHTMVDVYRLWTLWTLAKQVPPGDILEIGSWRGGSGTVLARALAASRPQDRGSSPGDADRQASGPNVVFLADTFAGVVKAGERDTYYKGGEHANTSPDIVRELLARAGVTGVEVLVGMFPEDTADRISDRRFALCHIDVDVCQSAADCFDWAWPRMVAGGVIVFDDYGFYGCEGVTAFVEEIAGTERNGARIVAIPSLSGQAIVAATSLDSRNRPG